MNEMFLLKMGEIVLKGLNRGSFEGRLNSNLSRRLRAYGKFKVRLLQSTVYVEPSRGDLRSGRCLGGDRPDLRHQLPVPEPWLREKYGCHF